jgi:putative DNA primase/helicase
MIAPHIIERARTVRIEDECARRSIHLRGVVDRCGPCPICGGIDRFAINTRKQVFHCRGCGLGGDVIRLVQHIDGYSFIEAVELLTGEQTRTPALPPAANTKQSVRDYEREQHRKARWLWSQRKPISGTPAGRYLREVRAITCPLPPTLGFLPPQKPEQHPAMIAAFALVDEPEPGTLGKPHDVESVHLTLLKPDGGGKADVEKPKIVIGSPGALPITLAPPNDLLALAVTEGIEDALALHEALGMGAWAAGAACFMPKLANTVPDYIEAVTIEMHPDARRYAEELAAELRKRGLEAFLREASA